MMTQLSHIVLFCCSSIAFRSLFLFLEHRGLRYYEFSLHQRVLLYTGMFVRDNALTWDNMLWLLPHVALFWPLSLTYTVEFGLFCGREQLPFSYAVEYDDVWWLSSRAWFDPVGTKAAGGQPLWGSWTFGSWFVFTSLIWLGWVWPASAAYAMIIIPVKAPHLLGARFISYAPVKFVSGRLVF